MIDEKKITYRFNLNKKLTEFKLKKNLNKENTSIS
jgi:hypothetical protein